MRSDARLLLNKKKWQKKPGNKQDVWKSRGAVDARKILNLKRQQKSKPPVLGSFMRTTSATALIASQIKKEISAGPKDPNKRVQLSKNGNIIVTSKSKTSSRVVSRKEGLPKVNIGSFSKKIAHNESMEFEPSTSVDDLEHTAIEDLIDVQALPSAYVPAISLQKPNLSRNSSVMSQLLDNRYTMVADQISQQIPGIATVRVSNLHPSVSRQDVMELFGEIAVIRSVDVIMPGTAVVEFFNKEDAIKACNIYHNRLLDGLPMQCYLVNSPAPQRFAVSERLGSRSEFNTVGSRGEFNTRATLQGVSPALTNSRSRLNPRNVQFTVKLT